MICYSKKYLLKYKFFIHTFLVDFKEARAKALSQSLNANEVEREIREKIEKTESKSNEVRFKLTNISNDEQDLEKKIERRQREYEQLQKRLAKLQVNMPFYLQINILNFSLFVHHIWTNMNNLKYV